MRKTIASFLFLLCAHAGIAQQRPFAFTNYSSANGLADNGINWIEQDSRGFMWFGTREGLIRFDGTSFKTFVAQKNNPNSLPGNSIGSIYEFRPGHLLIATGGGAICLNTITEHFYKPSFGNMSVLYSIRRLKKDIYTFNIGDTSFIMNGRLQITDTIIPPFPHSSYPANISLLDDSTWLLGNLQTYFLYNPQTKKHTPFPGEITLTYSDKKFFFQYYDKKNKWLYFSNYGGGIYRYSLTGELLYNWKRGTGSNDLRDANISFIIPKNDSILWIGGYENGGLVLLNTRTRQLSPVTGINTGSSPIFNSLTFNYTDKDKNEWIATSCKNKLVAHFIHTPDIRY